MSMNEDSGKLKIVNQPDPSRMTFEADELVIGSEKLCIKFEEQVLDLEEINELVFNIAGKEFKYKKED